MGITKEKSPMMKAAIQYVKDILRRMENDECSDEQIGHALGHVNAENKGYFTEESFVNYDKAMRILHIGNRVTLKAFLDRHGVKMQKINNVRVGFLRSEIEALATQAKIPPQKHKRAIL